MSANGIKGLVGYGQPDQHSMDEEKAQALVNHFEALKFDMAKTRDKADNYRGCAPAKTWFYNAVKLAVDEHEFKDFRTYGKLGHSHKVYLTHVE